MFAVLSPIRKALRPALGLAAAVALSACEPVALGGLGGGTSASGPKVDPTKPVQVALLVPKSDSNTQARSLAVELENAARMALAENPSAKIELKVYDTSGAATTAAAQAQRAVDEGAKIILGPLYAESVVAAGVAVADEGINVLGFSNNPDIIGGNVLTLNNTFANTANRLLSFARRQGKKSIVIISQESVAGQFGRIAIEQAATSNKIKVASTEAYALTEEAVQSTVNRAAAVINSGAADTIFITTEANNEALPLLLTLLPEAGVKPEQIQFIGLTRWDVKPQLFTQKGAQGAWFAIPDQSAQQAFNAKYSAAHGVIPNINTGMAYDGAAAIAGLISRGSKDALTIKALTSTGFNGSSGAFRLSPEGFNRRALAIATIKDNKMVILDPAPRSFSGPGS